MYTLKFWPYWLFITLTSLLIISFLNPFLPCVATCAASVAVHFWCRFLALLHLPIPYVSVSLRACGLTLLVLLGLVSVWDVVPVVILSGCWWFSHLTLLPHPLPRVMDLLVFHSFSDWWAPYVPGIILGIGIQSWTPHGIFLRKAGGSRVISEDTHYWEDTRCWQRDWVAWGLCDAQIWLSCLLQRSLCWPLWVLRVQSSSFALVASSFSCQPLPAPPLSWSASPHLTVYRAEHQCLMSFASIFWVDFLLCHFPLSSSLSDCLFFRYELGCQPWDTFHGTCRIELGNLPVLICLTLLGQLRTVLSSLSYLSV